MTPEEKENFEFERHVRWYEENLRILSDKARIVPFKLNRMQRILERYKWDCRRANKICYMLILKARKEGISTWAEATLFRDSVENEHRRTLVIAHDDVATSVLFEMTKRYHQFYLDERQEEIELERSNARELIFKKNQALFRVRTAGAGGSAGRSDTVQALHFSELDKWPQPEVLYQAVMNSIPDEGHIVVIAESTADGPMLFMNKLWDAAVEGRSEYQPFFFPWWVDDKYRRDLSWDDLMRYGPREFVEQNKVSLVNSRTQETRRLAEHGMGPSDLVKRDLSTADGSRLASRVGEGLPAPAQHAGEGSGGETSSPGSEDELVLISGSDVQGEGSSDGGQVHDPDDESEAPGSSSFAVVELGRIGRDDRPKGTPWRRELSEDRGSDADGWDPGFVDNRSGVKLVETKLFQSRLIELFRDSLTGYELGLCEEFDLDLEQVNWLRFALETKCNGDETIRRREFPSRYEEAFEASGADILDPRVMGKWAKEAKTAHREVGDFRFLVNPNDKDGRPLVEFVQDHNGKTEIYEWPKKATRYVAFFDPSSGVTGSDWQVLFVMNVETGDQAAEFRATIDADQACDQIEAICMHYAVKKLAIEVSGGYGIPFIRHMVDRKTVQLYEREGYHKWTKTLMKVPGWDTNNKTRPLMVAESKEAVRKEHCKIKSEETIRECRTLWENPTGKIEARPPNHDDGWIAFAGCCVLRNAEISGEKAKEETNRKTRSFVRRLNEMDRMFRKKTSLKHIAARGRNPRKVVSPGITPKPDGRRSWI